MFSFKVERELTLRAFTDDGNGCIFTKVGSWIAATSGDFKLDYVLVGPGQGSILRRFGGQLMRKFTGENLQLVRVISAPNAQLLFADQGQHISIIDISNGAQLKVESENILAFTNMCKYSVGVFTAGAVSQKGLATSVLTGCGPGSYVAITSYGNPIQIQTPCKVDPDCLVAFIGPDPRLEFNLSWKTVIGKTHGESYYLNFEHPGGVVIIQPYERESGVQIAIDNKPNAISYNKASNTTNQVVNTGNTLSKIGKFLGGN